MKKMSEQETNEYLSSVISGKVKVTDAIEGEAVAQFRRLTGEVSQAKLRMQNLQGELEQLRAHIPRLNGQREAYANLLAAAENARKYPIPVPHPTPVDGEGKPLSLEDLKKATGANKVEATDVEGNVLDSTDPAAEEEMGDGVSQG